jgi:hypothetical protein
VTDLNSLMIFAKVVEAKSFSEAARLLKMPTSTVSRRVADLEDELGVRLLDLGPKFSNTLVTPSNSTKQSTTSLQTTFRTSRANCGFLPRPASPTRYSRR